MMKFPWPWKKVDAIEEAERKTEVDPPAGASLDDEAALEDEEETEVSGEIERVVRQTKQSMNDGLDRLAEALAELEAEVHAIKGNETNGK